MLPCFWGCQVLRIALQYRVAETLDLEPAATQLFGDIQQNEFLSEPQRRRLSGQLLSGVGEIQKQREQVESMRLRNSLAAQRLEAGQQMMLRAREQRAADERVAQQAAELDSALTEIRRSGASPSEQLEAINILEPEYGSLAATAPRIANRFKIERESAQRQLPPPRPTTTASGVADTVSMLFARNPPEEAMRLLQSVDPRDPASMAMLEGMARRSATEQAEATAAEEDAAKELAEQEKARGMAFGRVVALGKRLNIPTAITVEDGIAYDAENNAIPVEAVGQIQDPGAVAQLARYLSTYGGVAGREAVASGDHAVMLQAFQDLATTEPGTQSVEPTEPAVVLPPR